MGDAKNIKHTINMSSFVGTLPPRLLGERDPIVIILALSATDPALIGMEPKEAVKYATTKLTPDQQDSLLNLCDNIEKIIATSFGIADKDHVEFTHLLDQLLPISAISSEGKMNVVATLTNFISLLLRLMVRVPNTLNDATITGGVITPKSFTAFMDALYRLPYSDKIDAFWGTVVANKAGDDIKKGIAERAKAVGVQIVPDFDKRRDVVVDVGTLGAQRRDLYERMGDPSLKKALTDALVMKNAKGLPERGYDGKILLRISPDEYTKLTDTKGPKDHDWLGVSAEQAPYLQAFLLMWMMQPEFFEQFAKAKYNPLMIQIIPGVTDGASVQLRIGMDGLYTPSWITSKGNNKIRFLLADKDEYFKDTGESGAIGTAFTAMTKEDGLAMTAGMTVLGGLATKPWTVCFWILQHEGRKYLKDMIRKDMKRARDATSVGDLE